MWSRRRITRQLNIQRMRREISAVDPRLLEANRLFEVGEYSSAAGIYQELAEEALSRQIPPAPHLFFMNGNAWMRADEIEKSIASYQKGFDILINRKKWGRLRLMSEKIFSRLKNNGFADQQEALKVWLDAKIPLEMKSLPIWKAKRITNISKVNLPSSCPHCGAPVDLEELEWFGANANCNYCGILLTGK